MGIPPRRASTTISAHAAIDLGASSGRVMLGVLSEGALDLREIHRFANVPVARGETLTWDLDLLFAESITGLTKAVAECAAEGMLLESIGIDSWGVDFAFVGGDGELVAESRHHRGAGDPAAYISARGMSEASVYAISGVPDQAINTSFQLSALSTEIAFAGQRPLFVPDVWVCLLTGLVGTEATIASTSQLMDPSTDDWSFQLINAHRLSGLNFAPISQPGSFAGRTTDAVTARIRSREPVRVYRVASHDTASAFAFASAEAGSPADAATAGGAQGLISSGTWSLVGVAVHEPVKTVEALAAHFTNERGAHGTLLLRNLNGMWVLQECIREWERADDASVAIDSLLDAAANAHGNEVVFDVADERLLAPGHMLERITTLCEEVGRPAPGSRGEIVRAILESLAAAYAIAIGSAEEVTRTPITSIRIVGGGSQNALLCQLTADITGLPVLAGPTEASSIGNIAVQAVASGRRADVAEVYRSLRGAGTHTTSYLPNGTRVSPLPAEEGIS